MTASQTLSIGVPVPHVGELEALPGNMSGLLEVLSWARPHGSEAEVQFIRDYLLPTIRDLGAPYEVDMFGNVWAEIEGGEGAGPSVLWSCHVDTVHSHGGRQAVRFQADGRTVELVKRKPGRCLGADDGAGLWLLLEMMRSGVPGGYVFHRGEEKGRLGSCWTELHEPERLAPFDACVAFDRRGHRDLITHQMGMRCASDSFADSLSDALNGAGKGLRYRPDDGGSYTDSYTYAERIAECCNVSVGYDREHGPSETLDALHLWRLRQAICSADLGGLVIERDPSFVEYLDWGNTGGGWGWNDSAHVYTFGKDKDVASDTEERLSLLLDLIERFPDAVAQVLLSNGIGTDEVLDALSPSELTAALSMGCGTPWGN